MFSTCCSRLLRNWGSNVQQSVGGLVGCGRFGHLSLSQRKVSPNVMVYSCLFHNLSGLEISTIHNNLRQLWKPFVCPFWEAICSGCGWQWKLPLIQMRRAARTWSVETTRKVTVYPWVTMCLPLFLFFPEHSQYTHTHIYTYTYTCRCRC